MIETLKPTTHYVFCLPIQKIVPAQKQWLLQTVLSAEERDRAQRFRKEEDRLRFIVAHGFKRRLLASQLGLDPKQLEFLTGPKGKPFCVNEHAPFFNIAHSGDWVLVAASALAELGVDVESCDRAMSQSVSQYALTVKQQQHVAATENPQLTAMLYWTQKEAISKALGLGLSIDFQTVNCSGELQKEIVTHGQHHLQLTNQLLQIPGGQNYVASAAATCQADVEFYCMTTWQQQSWSSELLSSKGHAG